MFDVSVRGLIFDVIYDFGCLKIADINQILIDVIRISCPITYFANKTAHSTAVGDFSHL